MCVINNVHANAIRRFAYPYFVPLSVKADWEQMKFQYT